MFSWSEREGFDEEGGGVGALWKNEWLAGLYINVL